MYRIINKVTILTLLAAVLASCSGNGEEQETTNENAVRLVPVETVEVVDGSFDDYIRLTGTVEALEDATISSETSGRVLSIKDRGTYVQKGETIAQLDDRLIEAQYNAAKATYDFAKDSYERLESLYADSIVTTQDFENALTQLDQAQAQLNQAEKQLEDASISAPFTGRIESRMISTGELINPGQPVARLVSAERVRIVTGIPERYTGEIMEETEVDIFLRALGVEAIKGNITYAGNVIDPETRTYAAEIEIENPDRLVKPDMIADLQIKRTTLEGVVLLPRTAVLRNEEGASVFRSSQENGRKLAELVSVETAAASGPFILIRSGVEVGDEIVVAGMRTLSSGDELNVLNTSTNLERIEQLKEQDRPVVSY
jgi:RND family efflux transporter MFP subunit